MSETSTRAARRAATSKAIIEAARSEFGDHGFEGATVRAIARRAGVDPSLVMQHYGTKRDLFRAATEVPTDLFAIAEQLPAGATPAEIGEHLADVLVERLGDLAPEPRALLRSMLTEPAAAAEMTAYLDERIANLARALGGPDASARAALIVSGILGVTIARHLLGVGALAEADPDRVVAATRAWLTPSGGAA